jgi:antitoxin FitA
MEGITMAQLLVRDLDPATIDLLKELARSHRRSLQGEVKVILEEAAACSVIDPRATVEQVRSRFAGKKFSDSAAWIREDRDR